MLGSIIIWLMFKLGICPTPEQVIEQNQEVFDELAKH
jgi:hypothetical protein